MTEFDNKIPSLLYTIVPIGVGGYFFHVTLNHKSIVLEIILRLDLTMAPNLTPKMHYLIFSNLSFWSVLPSDLKCNDVCRVNRILRQKNFKMHIFQPKFNFFEEPIWLKIPGGLFL